MSAEGGQKAGSHFQHKTRLCGPNGRTFLGAVLVLCMCLIKQTQVLRCLWLETPSWSKSPISTGGGGGCDISPAAHPGTHLYFYLLSSPSCEQKLHPPPRAPLCNTFPICMHHTKPVWTGLSNRGCSRPGFVESHLCTPHDCPCVATICSQAMKDGCRWSLVDSSLPLIGLFRVTS